MARWELLNSKIRDTLDGGCVVTFQVRGLVETAKDGRTKQLEAKFAAAQEENKQLREDLLEYGRHLPGCPYQYDTKYPCKCKWNEVRQALSSEERSE